MTELDLDNWRPGTARPLGFLTSDTWDGRHFKDTSTGAAMANLLNMYMDMYKDTQKELYAVRMREAEFHKFEFFLGMFVSPLVVFLFYEVVKWIARS